MHWFALPCKWFCGFRSKPTDKGWGYGITCCIPQWSGCNGRIMLRPCLLPTACITCCPSALSVRGIQCHQCVARGGGFHWSERRTDFLPACLKFCALQKNACWHTCQKSPSKYLELPSNAANGQISAQHKLEPVRNGGMQTALISAVIAPDLDLKIHGQNQFPRRTMMKGRESNKLLELNGRMGRETTLQCSP